MLGAIRQMGTDYYDALPNRILPTLMQSAAFSFAVAGLLAPKPEEMILNRPLQAAVMATTASLIHALITPLFKYCFGSCDDRWYAEVTKVGVVCLLTEALMQCGGVITNRYIPLSMNITAMAWNLVFRRTHHDNSAYIYYPNVRTW